MNSYSSVFKYVVIGIGCGVVFTIFTMSGRESYFPLKEEDDRTRTILLWNSYFELNDYGFGFGSESFVKNKCEFTNCYVTDNRTYLNISEFDAIVFHSPRLKSIPEGPRSYHQRYVFFSLESPDNVDTSKFNDNFYNWTISYRIDSDINYPYGKIAKNESKIKPNFDFAEKKNWTAWFVSNCHTKGGRENYVNLLKQHIPVDIYGKCGSHQCPRSTTASCYEMIEKKYKFYLSFENTICQDYVTEKLFNIMNYNLVPVVFGGANYSEILPPNSFINALDYKPQELAELLTKIGNSEEEYKKYFQWKEKYAVSTPEHPFCELCKKLHTDRAVKTYPNFNKWWRDKKCRRAPKFTDPEPASSTTQRDS